MDVARAYSMLGVAHDVTDAELKRAYRDLVRQWHPDKVADDPSRHHQAEARLKEINQAYANVRFLRGNGNGTARRSAPSTSAQPSGGRPRRKSSSTEDSEARYARFNAEAAERYREGREHAGAARWDEAISAFMQAVCLQPNNSDAYLELGKAYGEAGRPAKSAAAFKQAIRVRPDRQEFYARLAEACLDMDDPREAVWASTRLRKLKDLTAGDLTVLGVAYRRLRQYPQSLEALDSALHLEPNSAEIHYERGETLVARGDMAGARAVYERLQRLDKELAVDLLLSIIDAGTPRGHAREGF